MNAAELVVYLATRGKYPYALAHGLAGASARLHALPTSRSSYKRTPCGLATGGASLGDLPFVLVTNLHPSIPACRRCFPDEP